MMRMVERVHLQMCRLTGRRDGYRQDMDKNSNIVDFKCILEADLEIENTCDILRTIIHARATLPSTKLYI
jgi:hypothetical protein